MKFFTGEGNVLKPR